MFKHDEVMKTVYLVRHGQSLHNIEAVYQSQDVALSIEGREQVGKIVVPFCDEQKMTKQNKKKKQENVHVSLLAVCKELDLATDS